MAKKTNCTINGIDYYRVRATVGHKPDGKPIVKPFYGSCKSEAEAARDEYLESLTCGNSLDPFKMNVGQLFKYWMYQVKRIDSGLKSGSFTRYESGYRNHIVGADFLGRVMTDINSQHIQLHLNKMLKNGCTYSQMKETYKIIRMFFNFATDEGYYASYPCKKVVVPGEKPRKKEIETFTADEIKKIMSELNGHRMRLFYLLALHTGLRLGELLALRYEDIRDGFIYVTRSVSGELTIEEDATRKRTITVTTPKSADSERAVPFPAYLTAEFEAHHHQQLIERMELGLGKPDLMFTTKTGNLIDPTNVDTAHARILKRAGVQHKKFHTYRHTYGTEQIKHGTDIKTLQDLMGHSDITITMIYLHSDLNTKRKAGTALTDIYESAIG